jgi:hypothetical protein
MASQGREGLFRGEVWKACGFTCLICEISCLLITIITGA